MQLVPKCHVLSVIINLNTFAQYILPIWSICFCAGPSSSPGTLWNQRNEATVFWMYSFFREKILLSLTCRSTRCPCTWNTSLRQVHRTLRTEGCCRWAPLKCLGRRRNSIWTVDGILIITYLLQTKSGHKHLSSTLLKFLILQISWACVIYFVIISDIHSI